MEKLTINNQIIKRLEQSSYLGGLLTNVDCPVISVPEKTVPDTDLLRKHLRAIIDRFADYTGQCTDTDVLSFLRQQKRQFTLLWSIASLADCFDFQELGEWWSLFAGYSIDFAMRVSWRFPEIKRLCIGIEDDLNRPVPGLFVLGLGKLGGLDLNFSSDIDLVAFYDADRVPISPMQGKTDVCTRVLKLMTRLLADNTSLGFVWRVDWRLRPEASVNPLAMPTSAGLQFYYFRSLSWHRLALIKARVVAGDRQVGQEFLSDLDNFIWRINLDYRSLDELAELKQKINLEHPALRLAREQGHEITPDCADFNIKLGRGGIREIEFIVNAMQLIWGGRRAALRNPNTLDALKQLAREKLLDDKVARQLEFAYCLFRRVENAVQMLDNQQQYQLPTTPERQQALLHLLNQNSWQQLTEQLYRQRLFVAAEFDSSFVERSRQLEPVSDFRRLLEEQLAPAAADILDGWLNGFQIYGVANYEADELKALLGYLAEELHDSVMPVSEAIVKIDSFFRSLPSGIQYFRLLQEHPVLLQSIIRPLLISPPMATLLEQSPHIVDALILPEDNDDQFNPQNRSTFVLASERIEVRAERIRRYVNEELYICYLECLRGRISTQQLTQRLTNLAEHTLELGLTIICDEMELDAPPIAVLGLGKLGMKSMSPLSDLDLIFITDSIDDIEQANRFARRFQHLMETRMKEGIAYEMDTRLRPSGRCGPPTVSLESFRKYHQQRAHNWEHIALVPARFVAGRQLIGNQAGDIRQDVLTRSRDHQQFINDAWKMLDRIRQQRTSEVKTDNLAVKLRRGGLMEADYLAACIAIEEIPRHPHWVNLDYFNLLEEISNNTVYSELSEIIHFWSYLQVWVRLLDLESSTLNDFPAPEFECFLADLKLSSQQALLEKMNHSAETIQAYIFRMMQDRSIETTEAINDWEEQAVIWL